MNREINHFQPSGPVSAYKSYVISAPIQTHFRSGTCEEADCPQLAAGWVTYVDESTDLGERQAFYIRRKSGRVFTEDRHEDGRTGFIFSAGQECFYDHQIRLEREPVFAVRGGDWRGNPRREFRVHDSPGNWVEDFGVHQETLKRAQD